MEGRVPARAEEVPNHKEGSMSWQPIETAPKDGTDILVLINSATVWVVHIAWWRTLDEDLNSNPDHVGWWSYTEHSVTQKMLDEYSRPLYWQPFAEPEGWKFGSKA